MTKYIKILENNHDKSNYIKVYLNYDLGGTNYFTGKIKERGYYLTVLPVEKGGGLEGFTAFTGFTELIHPVNRKSEKAGKIASEKAKVYEKMMVEAICAKYGYILEE